MGIQNLLDSLCRHPRQNNLLSQQIQRRTRTHIQVYFLEWVPETHWQLHYIQRTLDRIDTLPDSVNRDNDSFSTVKLFFPCHT